MCPLLRTINALQKGLWSERAKQREKVETNLEQYERTTQIRRRPFARTVLLFFLSTMVLSPTLLARLQGDHFRFDASVPELYQSWAYQWADIYIDFNLKCNELIFYEGDV